jgi:Immunity protein 27
MVVVWLAPDETELVGAWASEGARVARDPVEQRIDAIVASLEEVARSSDGWDTLYRDPNDGRYWELTYPQSGMHGGGPRRLANVPSEVAIPKYRLVKPHL